MIFIDWFWVVWYSMLGLAVVLVWITEFSSAKFGKKSKKKTIWQESKDRIHQQHYRSTYGSSVSYNTGRRNYGKGM